MPKLNSRGDVICGVAGIQGSLNGVPYPFRSEGRGCWRDDDVLLVAAVDRGPGVWRWWPFQDPSAADLKRIDARAFNKIAGGGGSWAALIQGAAPLLFGSRGDLPGAGAADFALDGTMVFPPDYFAANGLTIDWLTGTRTNPNGVTLWYHAVNGSKAIWPGGADGRPAPRPALPEVDLRLVELAGEAWLLYWSEGVGIVLQPDGEAEGYVIALPNGFDNDLIVRAGSVLAAIGLSQGEGPTDYLLIEATRAGARYVGHGEDAVREGPPIVWRSLVTPPDPPTIPPPVVRLASVTPTTGEAPLTVRAVAAIESGQADRLEWWVRSAGDALWIVDADNAADDLDHHFRFDAAGDYEIRVHAIGPGGTSDADGPAISVTPADTPVPPIPPQPPEHTMTYVYIDSNDDKGTVFKCEQIDLGRGDQFSYRDVMADKLVTRLPNGGWRHDGKEHAGEPWQTFIRTPKSLIAEREDHGALSCFTCPYEEREVPA